MSEIKVLETFPIVFTKDKTWKPTSPKPGAIIVLPEDAILVLPVKETTG
jgi:hypothetical protein